MYTDCIHNGAMRVFTFVGRGFRACKVECMCIRNISTPLYSSTVTTVLPGSAAAFLAVTVCSRLYKWRRHPCQSLGCSTFKLRMPTFLMLPSVFCLNSYHRQCSLLVWGIDFRLVVIMAAIEGGHDCCNQSAPFFNNLMGRHTLITAFIRGKLARSTAVVMTLLSVIHDNRELET